MNLDEIKWDAVRVPIITAYYPLHFNTLVLEDSIVAGSYIEFDRKKYWRATPDASKEIPTRYFISGWQCRKCNTTFFGTAIQDLEHSCTGRL
jgi:hypothetical protein